MIPFTENGVELIKHFEGCRLTPYYCSAGVLTIGYGTTEAVLKPIPESMSQEYAEELLIKHIKQEAQLCAWLIDVELSDHQADAVMSFIYNFGSGKFQSSGLRQCINQKRFDEAVKEFPKWRRASGIINAGLVRRRACEALLFRDGIIEYYPVEQHPELVYGTDEYNGNTIPSSK